MVRSDKGDVDLEKKEVIFVMLPFVVQVPVPGQVELSHRKALESTSCWLMLLKYVKE